jgi:hypothetical protein
LGCTTNQRSIPFGNLLHLLVQVVIVKQKKKLVQGHQDHHLFPGVFTIEVADEVGDKEAGYTTTIQTLLEAFSDMSPRSACFTDEAFLW